MPVEVRCEDCSWRAYTIGSGTWYTSGSVVRYPALYCDSCCGGSQSGWNYSGSIVKLECKGCSNMLYPVTWSDWNRDATVSQGRCGGCRTKKLDEITSIKNAKENEKRRKSEAVERRKSEEKRKQKQQQQQQQEIQRLRQEQRDRDEAQKRRNEKMEEQRERDEAQRERRHRQEQRERDEAQKLENEKRERRHRQELRERDEAQKRQNEKMEEQREKRHRQEQRDRDEAQKRQNAKQQAINDQRFDAQEKKYEQRMKAKDAAQKQQAIEHKKQTEQNEQKMRKYLKEQQQHQRDEQNKILNRLETRHKEQLSENRQNMKELKEHQKERRIEHKQQIKLHRESQERLQGQILKAMDDRKEQQKAFERREEKIKHKLDVEIYKVKAQNIKDQKLYNAKLQELHEKSDRKLKALEEKRKKDRKFYEKDMRDIAAKNEENMKTLKENELKSRLNQAIQLAYVRLQQYKEKKETALAVFEEYKKELLQIKLEERRINTHFFHENKNPNIANVVLLGVTGHGKSTFGCRLVGDKSANCDSGLFEHSDCVQSETQLITKKVVQQLWKRDISVTDTPGIYESGDKDREHTNNLIEFLRGCGGVNAFILVKTRYPPRFEATWKSTLTTLEALLGRAFWKNVIVVITHTKGKDKHSFGEYSSAFRKRIYKDLVLDEDEAKLPFIGVDSFENYKDGVAKLIDIIPHERFKCDELRSPLQELKLRNENITKRKLDNLKQELNTIKQTILLSNKEINNANRLLSQNDDSYVPQVADLSLIDKEAKDLWHFNIVLPPLPTPTKPKISVSTIHEKEEKDEKDGMDEKCVEWVPVKQTEYKYLAKDLGDDGVTLSLLDEDFKTVPWQITFDSNHSSDRKWLAMINKGVADESDLLVTINEVHYANNADKQMVDIKRKIKNVEVD